ncbi:HAMP domain-containing sensor histidine kinase [Pseudoalteromonas tetraodonis]|uniref:sensor histidine kinase n=1 Tax=Pseudoalteromonas tetraodonis TaxID=43659 RepID=UPI003002B53D
MTKLLSFRYWHLASLQRSLLFYVVLPMLLLTGLAIRFGLAYTHELVTSSMRTDLELIGRAIRIPISDALLKKDTQTINAHLESVFTIGRVYGASIYDVDGKLVAATGVIERDLTNSQLASEVVRTGQQQDGYRSVSGESLFSHFLPIVNRSGQIHGLLQISRKASDFEQSLAELSNKAWLSWFALALLSLLIMWRGHKRAIGQPINELVNSMRQVASGDRRYRARLQGPLELQEVAKGLNHMLDEINAAEQQLLAQQAQQQKIEKRLKEQETMAAIGQVVSGVAHELGAPLSVIDGRAQRLLRQHCDEDSQRQLLAVRGQVLRLNHMVKQLQAFAHTPVTSWQRVALLSLLQKAVQSISYELQEDEKQPEIKLPCPDILLHVDIGRLELAIVNVLRNAIQAASSHVVIESKQQHDELIITIKDDGQGLTSNLTNEQVMTPFVSTKPQGQGTGLGLAIVQQIMQEHRGTVSLKNSPKKGGCEVTLTLPLTKQDIF